MDRYARSIRLKGTPRQVFLAAKIRAGSVAAAERACRAVLASLSAGPSLDAQSQEMWSALMLLAATRDAGWWIGHRQESGADLHWRAVHHQD